MASKPQVEFNLSHTRQALGLEANAGGSRGDGDGPRLSSLELGWPRPPPPTLPQAGSPQPSQTLGPRRDRAAGSLEHPRAPKKPPGRAEEPAPLTSSGSGAARPRPRRPGSRRAAGGLQRSATEGPTSPRAPPPMAGCHVTRGTVWTASARPRDCREGGASAEGERGSEGVGMASWAGTAGGPLRDQT